MVSRLVLEYDGGGFSGWARQPGLRSVQEEVERALAVVLRRGCASDCVPVTVAGRTDAGVHALGQVASYSGEPARVESLNALLPDDVAVLSCSRAPDGFDARRSATSRAYCYRVLARRSRSAFWRGRALHWPHPVSVADLEECAAALVGTHDFTAFTPTDTYHVHFSREVSCAFWRESEVAGSSVLEFWIEGDAFMRNMNRVLVGTMLQVGGGRRSVSDFVSLLSGRPRSEAGPTAPPYGLYLAGVGYEGVRILDGVGSALGGDRVPRGGEGVPRGGEGVPRGGEDVPGGGDGVPGGGESG